MSSFTVQRSGFSRVPELFYAISTDLLANGFSLKFPASPLAVPVSGTDYAVFKVTLESSADTDPLNAEQPWRIQLDAKALQVGDIYIASPLQIPNDGTVAKLDTTDSMTTQGELLPSGMLNVEGKFTANAQATTDLASEHFISRSHRITSTTMAGAYPFSYRLSISSNGVTLFVWEDASDNSGKSFQWFSVQRPVDHLTGLPTLTGHTPLFCVFGLRGEVSKFIVRERDILRPTKPVSASVDSEDSNAILNAANQVAITENNRYVITFPNGLNTSRYMYTEELDMIAYTSADVVSMHSDVPITVYGETTPRVYKAMNSNGPNNTGMRILMLTSGGPMAA